MFDSFLPAIEIETQPNVDAAVIWMHGLGDSGHGWSSVVSAMPLSPRARIRFIFPHAPAMPVTINQGYVMPAWYDISDGALHERNDIAGMKNSQTRIEALMMRERERGIAPERLVLAGFSQGGAVALYTGLRYPERLAGIVALSTYLVAGRQLAEEASATNRQVPIFMAHGDDDPVVLPKWAEASRDALRALNYSVDYHTYPMPHSATDAELRDAGDFLTRVLPVLD